MSPTEKIIITKVKESLNRSLSWGGNSNDWTGYANQMRNSIRDSMGFLDGLLEIPEKQKQGPVGPGSNEEKLDSLLP